MSDGQRQVRKGFIVRGHVQGVGFRWSTTRRARRLGLRGTVRNRADGTVEVHATGPREELDDLQAWLHEGPRSARVEGVEEIPADDDLPRDFEILR